MGFKEDWTINLKEINIYVCFDNDEAGIKGAINVNRFLLRSWTMELPKEIGEHGDVTDFFTKLKMITQDFVGLASQARTFLTFMPSEVLYKDKKLRKKYKDYANTLLKEQTQLISEDRESVLLQGF